MLCRPPALARATSPGTSTSLVFQLVTQIPLPRMAAMLLAFGPRGAGRGSAASATFGAGSGFGVQPGRPGLYRRGQPACGGAGGTGRAAGGAGLATGLRTGPCVAAGAGGSGAGDVTVRC